ncbi:MAG TPA: RluA family pseudouridine synthase [Candidatus Omnitrophota bacterium]|nr:RluA family pseudouridine synthase [Candidatus Omnitrophota bacterium]HPS36410.1 RluA family pseudouridine synthase [Candidatus Omnitrophota bacterium]
MRTFEVRSGGKLLEYLFKELSDTSKTRVRQLLKFRTVLVNGAIVTQFDHPLVPGDQVGILSLKEARPEARPKFGITIVYEDDAILVIEKPSGLLTVSTESVGTQTAFYAANEHVCKTDAANSGRPCRPGEKLVRRKKIFIVHRLDREASGLLIFAKDLEIKTRLQSGWTEVRKKYYAVVEGIPQKPAGTLTSFLRENKFLKVYSTKKEEAGAKRSTTHYRVLRSSAHYSLLEVELETGRKHQIRVHLSDMGHPIAGDDRYGAKTNPAGRLALHAFHLALMHPVTGEPVVFTSAMPDVFGRILTEDKIPATGTPSKII